MFIYTSKESIVSNPASRGHLAPITTLNVPPVATALLSDATFRELVPEPPRRDRIGVADKFVVIGVTDYMAAVEQGYETVTAVPVVESDEDTAVVQMWAAKDLLPTAKNELAMGRAYLVTEQTIKKLPKQNTRNDRTAHRKRYGVQRSERLDAMWGKVFGVSKTTLRRYARALDAPAEVRRLFLAGHMDLDDVLKVVEAGSEVARRVENDLLAGHAVVDVLKRHIGDGEARKTGGDEPGPNKDAVVGLMKSLNRWSKLLERSKEPPALTREQDRSLEKGEELIAWLRRKVG